MLLRIKCISYNTMKKTIITYLIPLALTCGTNANELNIPDGADASIGGVLFPHLHITGAIGDSSEDPEDLAAGAHDPTSEFTVQGIEPGLSLRLHENLEGFATWNFAYGAEEEWEDEFEEGFIKLTNLPGGFELRGGRLLNRFGDQNTKHLHAWDTIDQHLVNARFLGDEALATEGADLTWYLPTSFSSALTVSYGEALAHDHGHGEEEHGHDEEEEEGHHDEGEEAEEAGFEDDFISANLVVKHNRDDFNQYTFSGSLAQGENGFGEDTTIIGIGAHYTWRENGLEAGGNQFTWKNEFFFRDYKAGEGHGHGDEDDEGEHHDEEEEEGHDEEEEGHHDEDEHELAGDDEFGFYSNAVYTFNKSTAAGLRLDYVAGVEELGLQERLRLSPHLTWHPTGEEHLHVRFQYNYDDREEDGDAHSGWVQLQYSFGGKEVR